MHKITLSTTIALIIMIAFAGIFLYYAKIHTVSSNVNESSDEAHDAQVTIDTSNWQTYKNEEYGFEVKYPTDWIFGEYPKNKYGTILYITSPDVNVEHRGKLNVFGDNVEVSIFPFESIKHNVEKQPGINIETIDDLFALSTSTTEICKLEDINFFGEKAYIVQTFGATGHSGILVDHAQKYYLILFEGHNSLRNLSNSDIIQKKCFAQETSSVKFDIASELMPEEYAILQSFRFLK